MKEAGSKQAQHISADTGAEIAAGGQSVRNADLFGAFRGASGVVCVWLPLAEATIQNEKKDFFVKRGTDLGAALKLGDESQVLSAEVHKQDFRSLLLMWTSWRPETLNDNYLPFFLGLEK